ncbi:dTDP-4-dehydrorhamnose reductase [Breoghania sp.]|uniref:dTDP-4-dehydrorhamnose reductase n=1 Tax=Breoghania sp. TaxID=2065378 RepID=UPI0026206A35|nr:dTDP-4-dehydrorhamnose reductase [Breoghania sp.]MDJ0933207.1 dTDP-4-dehydrorhamnose reductase [Breoghania sp.]
MTRLLTFGSAGQFGTDIAAAAKGRADFTFLPFGRDRLDLSDTDAIRLALEREDFDVVLYCASVHKTDAVELDADPAFQVNVRAADAIAAWCAEAGKLFVYYSTDYVFSGIGRKTPYDELAAKDPVNVYGASKAMGETLVLRYPTTTVLRMASLFGTAGASGKGGNFVETMIRFGRERGKLSVVNDQVMSPTATADIVKMTLDLLAAEAPAGIYHVVNSGQASWYEFACEIIKLAGVDAVVEPTTSAAFKTVALRPAYSVLDTAKLSRIIGTPDHWRDALARYMAACKG